MFISTLDNLLTANDLRTIHQIVGSAHFVSGHISGGSAKGKHNLELNPETAAYGDIVEVLENSLKNNLEFNLTAFPRYMTRPIISRYDSGMFYDEHIDSPVMNFMNSTRPTSKGLGPIGGNYVRSDLSLTLFLNSPSSYEGGELTFATTGGRTNYKLQAGSAVLYPTGVRHAVSPIMKGVRFAAIFWIQTMFPNETERQLVCDARRLIALLGSSMPGSAEHKLSEEVFFNLSRLLAEI